MWTTYGDNLKQQPKTRKLNTRAQTEKTAGKLRTQALVLIKYKFESNSLLITLMGLETLFNLISPYGTANQS